MRYNPTTDMVEIFYNGIWNEWKTGYLQAEYLIAGGIISAEYNGWNASQQIDHVLIPNSNSGYISFKVDLTGRNVVRASFVASNGGNSSAWECFGVYSESTSMSSGIDILKNNAIIKTYTQGSATKTYNNVELNVSNLNGVHQIMIGGYVKNIKITELLVA